MEDDDNNNCAVSNSKETNPTSRRPSMKTQTPFNDYSLWKHKLRESCFKRVREDRTRLLWKMRLPTPQSLNNKDFIQTAFQDIVSDELKKIKELSADSHLESSTPGFETDDMLWEYNGLCDAYRGECEEMLLEMQRIFYEDLKAEPTRKEPDGYTETWEDEEDEYLAHAVYEHMQLNDEQVGKEIWCPICRQGELQENLQLIYCSRCKLQLSRGNEVTLEILQTRLAEAHIDHLDQGCRSKPKFCVETRFGLTALYIFCNDCHIFEVVI